MILAFVIGVLAVLLAIALGCLMERHSPNVGGMAFPVTPPEVVAWREAQDRRAARQAQP